MSPTTKPTQPVDIYVRVSRVGGRDVTADGGSASEQEAQCRAQLTHDGLDVGEVFVDLDESGGKTSRPQFDIAMQRVRDGVSGGIIVKNLRRFGRTTAGVVTGLNEIEKHGAVFISCEERIDTSSPMQRFVVTVLAALGQMELEERTLGFERARANAVSRGIHVSARVPAGYSRGEDRVLVPNEYAPAIREAFEARADGATWAEVAAVLNAAGVPKSRETDGATWSEQAVAQLVENRVYLGEARSGKDSNGEAIVNADAHEPIVDAGLFARVAARKDERGSFANPERRRDLLAGLVRCAGCGGAMVKDQRVKDGKVVQRYLRCASRCDERAAISTRVLEDYVFSVIRERGAELKIVAPRSNDAAVKAAQIALDNAQAALDDFVATFSSQGLSAAVAASMAASLEQARDEAAKALNETSTGGGQGDWEGLGEVADEDIAIMIQADPNKPVSGALIALHILSVDQVDNAKARRLVRQVVKSVVVTKGRAPVAERVEVELA